MSKTELRNLRSWWLVQPKAIRFHDKRNRWPAKPIDGSCGACGRCKIDLKWRAGLWICERCAGLSQEEFDWLLGPFAGYFDRFLDGYQPDVDGKEEKKGTRAPSLSATNGPRV